MLTGVCVGKTRKWMAFSKPADNQAGCVIGLGRARFLVEESLGEQCVGVV